MLRTRTPELRTDPTARSSDPDREGPAPGALRPALSQLGELWQEHALFIAVVLGHLTAGIAVDSLGIADVFRPGVLHTGVVRHFLRMLLVSLLPMLAWYRLRARDEMGGRIGGLKGWLVAAADLRHERLSTRVLGGATLVCILLAVSVLAHDGWKGTIATLHPYAWDPALADLDRVLHGGRDAWAVLQPALGRPSITLAVDRFYALWYPLLTVGLLWQAWSTDRESRAQFFLCYALVWVLLGTVTAHLLSSGGPCFYAGLAGDPTRYEPLMRYLYSVHAQTPLTAIRLQEAAWRAYSANGPEYWISISAMPSLHVAMVALFAIVGWRRNAALGLLITAFLVLTLVGSVHLGWHYAVDGYAAILGVAVLWPASGFILRRWNARRQPTMRSDVHATSN